MVYIFPDESKPIQQGDIFCQLPLPLIDLSNLVVIADGELYSSNWADQMDEPNLEASIPLEKTWGIVATQNCDASRAPFISFFQIDTFSDVTTLHPGSPKKWMDVITRKSRQEQKWFYLPVNDRIGFKDKMAVNFLRVFQIQLSDLQQNIALRKGRLNKIAYEHYRESIAQYFRRYPYDEWYPLDNQEFAKYNERNEGCIIPFEWQVQS